MKVVLGLHRQCICGGTPNNEGREEGSEVKAGRLYLIQTQNNKTRRMPMYACVYQNCYEHYIVIFRDQRYTKNAVFVNLKTSQIRRNEGPSTEFVVIPDSIDGVVFTFQTDSEDDLDSWLSALQPTKQPHRTGSKKCLSPSISPVIPRSPLMPALAEADEEDD